MFAPVDILSFGHAADRGGLGCPGHKILQNEYTGIALCLQECRTVAGKIFTGLAVGDGARDRARDLFDTLTVAHLVFVTETGPRALINRDLAASKKTYESMCTTILNGMWSLAKALGAPERVGGFLIGTGVELVYCRRILVELLQSNKTYQRPDLPSPQAIIASYFAQEQVLHEPTPREPRCGLAPKPCGELSRELCASRASAGCAHERCDALLQGPEAAVGREQRLVAQQGQGRTAAVATHSQAQGRALGRAFEGLDNNSYPEAYEVSKIRDDLLSSDRAIDEARSKIIAFADQVDHRRGTSNAAELYADFDRAVERYGDVRSRAIVAVPHCTNPRISASSQFFSPTQSMAAAADRSRILIPVQQGIPFSLSVSSIVQDLFASQHASLCPSEATSTNYADDMAFVPESVMLAIEAFSDVCVRHQRPNTQ
jgi:hypothetical protein